MPRKFLRRLSAPYRGNRERSAWYIRPFRALLAHPVYFSINRRSITGGLALGVLVGVLPFIGHTPVVVVAALLLRVNLPVAVLATWVANPLTWGPIFYGEYRLGAYLLGRTVPVLSLAQPWEEIRDALLAAGRPLWVGAAVGALLAAGLTYLLANAAWRVTTRWRLQRRATRRRQIRQSRPPAVPPEA